MRRSVLVTGASSGIGLATALHVARLGFDTIASVRVEEKVDVLTSAATKAGVEVEPVVLDVTDEAARRRVLADRDLYGLVNNAGYYNVGAIEDVPPADAARQLETMVVAPMRLAQLVLPGMRARGQGRIINVTSGIVHTNGALTGWYQSCKQALVAASDALRMEVADGGVDVVQVEPGAIDTDIWRKAEQDLLHRRVGSSSVAAYDRALRILRTLEGRMRPPMSVAEVIGDALTAGQPDRRYRVGAETGLLGALGSLLPTGARDRLVRTVLNL